MRMEMSKIKVSKEFAETHPSELKVKNYRNFWNQYKRQKKAIVLDDDGVIVDGYIQYLILKENGVEFADVKRKYNYNYRKNPTTYVFGKHLNSNCDGEFVWRVPYTWATFAEDISVGDTIYCRTKYGKAPIIVTKIQKLDKPPVDMVIKKVLGKQKAKVNVDVSA